jgi:hypothetical protein
MNNNNMFESSTSICSDDCWKTAKELHNNKISDYNLLPNNFVDCENPNVRMTDGYLLHPNLRGRPGYGLSDDCLIDNYSALRNNPDGMTNDKCRIQLNNRIFTSGPSLRCGVGNIGEELNLIEGTNTTPFQCKKLIMEKEMKSGCYIITNQKKEDEKYLVLISGYNPFLKIELIWDSNKNIIVSDDVLRGKNFDWVLQN